MTRIAIATCREHAHGHPDDLPLLAALPEFGLRPVMATWNDPAVDWSSFDAVLIRTIWDYYQHHDDWLAWLSRLDAAGVAVLNPTAVLRWNADKRYLVELEPLGIATIPSRIASCEALRATIDASGWADVVVKPTISAGAWHTLRGSPGDPAFAQALAQLPVEITYLVQPYVDAVAHAGEWSLLFFGGEYSHAVLKRPRSGDFRVQEKHGGTTVAATPVDALVDAARDALARLAPLRFGDLAYARVDGVFDAGVFRIMELELIEPQLFFGTDAAAAGRFASSLARRLGVARAR